MKTYLILFLAACQSMAAMAQDDNAKTLYLTKSLANDAINSVEVTTAAGGIMVSGRSGEAPRLEMYVTDNNNDPLSHEEAQKRLEERYYMSIDVKDHELVVDIKPKHDEDREWRNNLSVQFRIYVPKAVTTDLKTSGGGIELDNLEGNETFRTSGGGLDIKNVSGVIRGGTSGGGIIVDHCSKDIDVTTSGGGIIARDCEGTIRLVTSGGGLELDNLKGDITAHTSGGGVEASHIEGEFKTGTSGGSMELRAMNCSLDATTSAGSIDAELLHIGKYVRLHSSAGNIDVRLPASEHFNLDLSGEKVSENPTSNFKGTWDKRSVNGEVNGGGAEVEVHAIGLVDVSFK